MSDLAATNCGCGCDDSCTGNSGCGLGRCFGDCNSIIWILLILCCCGNGNNGCGCGQHNGYGMTAIVLSSYCFCYADAVEIISADSYFSFYYFKKLPFLRQLIFCMKFY